MKSPIFNYIFPAALLLCGCQEAPTSKEQPRHTSDSSPVTTAKVLSAKEAVAAAEKKFNGRLPGILKSHDGVLDVMESHAGDFTGNGMDDVAIYFALSPSGGGNAMVGQGLALYENTGSDVKALAGFEPDYLFVFDTIVDGKIQVEQLEYAEGDGHCCPSIRTSHVLTISGNKAE